MSITWHMDQESFRVAADNEGKQFNFVVREKVVMDLFEAGDGDALERLERLVDVAAMPYVSQQLAS